MVRAALQNNNTSLNTFIFHQRCHQVSWLYAGRREGEISRETDRGRPVCECEYMFEMKDGREIDRWFNIRICEKRQKVMVGI